jgi:uncharacterized protein YjbJ (UPF0337 family)
MNWDQLQGEWMQVKGRLRERWGKLTDQDIESIGGKKDRLLGALRERYGLEADKATREVEGWMSNLEQKIKGNKEKPGEKPGERH